jgi:4-alpha-glucanotransferase
MTSGTQSMTKPEINGLRRSSGILLHPTSLPSRFGIGDFGPSAHRFVEQLVAGGQKIWQVLPLGPTRLSGSPYQSVSSFAGNPLLISPELLVENGYLSAKDLRHTPRFPNSRVDFENVTPYKHGLLRRAFAGFSPAREFRAFERRSAAWLEPFARFMALKSANGGKRWTHFDPRTKPSDDEIRFQKFVQFEFFRQWSLLRKSCAKNHIAIFGDIPFYVERDSADVWAHPEFFDLDSRGEPRHVGGVPPDYFSRTGQLWGNPVYHWGAIAESGFRLWIDRFRATLDLVDMARIDHFRGFIAFWEVPARARTAQNGHWIKAPGARMFAAARRALGRLPFVAENLGVITPEVEAVRREFAFPGMTVLQFAFDGKDSPHRPHNYQINSVAFTGTHDNDTVCGWWNSLRKNGSSAKSERACARAYLQLRVSSEKEIHWHFITAVLSSVAQFAVIPLQDVFGLGSEARMNVPGHSRGNWRWRITEAAFDDRALHRLSELTAVTGR